MRPLVAERVVGLPHIGDDGGEHAGILVAWPHSSFLAERVAVSVVDGRASLTLSNSKHLSLTINVGELVEIPPQPARYATVFAPNGHKFALMTDGTRHRILQEVRFTIKPGETTEITLNDGPPRLKRDRPS